MSVKLQFNALHPGERFTYALVDLPVYGHPPVFTKYNEKEAASPASGSVEFTGDVLVWAIDREAPVVDEKSAEDEVEQLRVQLSGCGVIAGCNTHESLRKQMPAKGDFGWSDSLLRVQEGVLREIALREANAGLTAELAAVKQRLVEVVVANPITTPTGGAHVEF